MQKRDGYKEMAGTYLNNRKNHEETIRRWVNAIVRHGGIERYDDLHIDQIDSTWRPKEFWVSAALQSFELAVRIRDETKMDLSVVLAFSLESDERPKGINFNNSEGLKRNFHVTPPSLYLFRPGTEFWAPVAEQMTVEEVDPVPLFGASPVIKRCIYMEFKRPDSEDYTRSLFVVG
jgi:hypothetical protein